MIHNELWSRINPKISGMLCLVCLETRLGRALHRDDFTSAPVNSLGAGVCPELALRLTRDPPTTHGDSTAPAPGVTHTRNTTPPHAGPRGKKIRTRRR